MTDRDEQEWDYFARHSGKNPVDVLKRFRESHNAAIAGRHEEALDGYIWFHENSQDEPGMGGVRLSFALLYWMDLARVYPPARTALEDIRDRKTKSLLNGIRDFPFFHDVVSINRHLGCERATYELFVALNSSNPILARYYATLAMPAIINCGDFELARQVMPSPTEELQRLKEMFQQMHEGIELQTCIHIYANGVKMLLATLRGTGDFEQAAGVLSSALESFESPEDREAVRIAIEGPE